MYQDAFYISGNIIGYTGNLFRYPTVYFLNRSTFGRITQAHDDPTNIGRNVVRTKADYRIANSGGGRAQEFYDGRVQHNSRSRFIPVTDGNRPVLARAIARFPNQKPR